MSEIQTMPGERPTAKNARRAHVAGRILQIYAEGGGYDDVCAAFGGKRPTGRDGSPIGAAELITWAIDACLSDDAKREGAARLVAMLEDIAGARIGDFLDWSTDAAGIRKITMRNLADISRQDQAAISGIKEGPNGLEVKFEGKLRAAELLGRIYGVLVDRSQIDVNITAHLAERLDRASKRLSPPTIDQPATP